ncbi:MAG: TIGR04211 family SH3 domain-containing protein [Panacagrimonas sp.]
MILFRRIGLFALWCFSASAASAQDAASRVRYISDETAITLREDKGISADVAGLLKSGTRVELLETDAASGYARVRVAAGREGWVLTRYLSTEPAARERLAVVQSQLNEQQTILRRLQTENARLRQQIGTAAPAAAASPVAEVAVDGAAETGAEAEQPSDVVRMITGAGLFMVGLLAGLMIPLLPRGGRRRWTPEL